MSKFIISDDLCLVNVKVFSSYNDIIKYFINKFKEESGSYFYGRDYFHFNLTIFKYDNILNRFVFLLTCNFDDYIHFYESDFVCFVSCLH